MLELTIAGRVEGPEHLIVDHAAEMDEIGMSWDSMVC